MVLSPEKTKKEAGMAHFKRVHAKLRRCKEETLQNIFTLITFKYFKGVIKAAIKQTLTGA